MSVVASISAASVYMNAVPLSLSIGGVVKDGNGKSTAPGTPGSTLSGISMGVGMISATPPVALGASGKQSNTTYSAIAPGTIDIASGDAASRTVAATIGRDTAGANAGALTQQYDANKREEIALGFAAATQLSNQSGTFLSEQGRKADQWRGGSGILHSGDKWIADLTAAMLAARRGQDEQATTPEPQPGVQGEGGTGRREGREDAGRAGAAV